MVETLYLVSKQQLSLKSVENKRKQSNSQSSLLVLEVNHRFLDP